MNLVRFTGKNQSIIAAAVLGLSGCGMEVPDAEPTEVQKSALSAEATVVSPLGALYRTDGAYDTVTISDIEDDAMTP